jgi:hypothetical protein
MVDWSSFGVSTIASLIGGGFLVFAVTTFYTDFYNKPLINIYPNGTTILLNNTGKSSATNLLLTVPIPGDISYKQFASHIFSNEKLESGLLTLVYA